MNEFCAAMGICNLRHLDDEIEKRSHVVARYRELLGGVKGIHLCPGQKDVTPNHAYFPVVFDKEEFGADRDEVFAKLEENNIFARKYFYPITTAFDCYKGRFDPDKTPVALDISKRVLTLPIYADLSLEIVDTICELILSLARR
jgi:dTDP-4-amino-4,6-dideoxygalactose transaminase